MEFNKICKKCGVKKSCTKFYKRNIYKDGYRSTCKACINVLTKQYYKENPEKRKSHSKTYYTKNKEKVKAANKKWLRANPGYKKKNSYVRYHENIQYRLTHLLRERIRKAIKRNSKVGSAVQDLGCSIEEFKVYLENQFHKGMTWKNHGEWEIDHIIPLNSFDLEDREQFLKACHYTNLQPLWELENRQKSGNLNWHSNS